MLSQAIPPIQYYPGTVWQAPRVAQCLVSLYFWPFVTISPRELRPSPKDPSDRSTRGRLTASPKYLRPDHPRPSRAHGNGVARTSNTTDSVLSWDSVASSPSCPVPGFTLLSPRNSTFAVQLRYGRLRLLGYARMHVRRLRWPGSVVFLIRPRRSATNDPRGLDFSTHPRLILS